MRWLTFFFATPKKAESVARGIISQLGYRSALTSSPFICDIGHIIAPELGEWMNLEGIVAYDEPGYALLQHIWKSLYDQGLCDHTPLTQFYMVELPKEHVTAETTGYYQFQKR